MPTSKCLADTIYSVISSMGCLPIHRLGQYGIEVLIGGTPNSIMIAVVNHDQPQNLNFASLVCDGHAFKALKRAWSVHILVKT
jgi:hypothetical protein